MKTFLKIDEIPIGSKWLAADGGGYSHIAIAIDKERDEVIVQPSDRTAPRPISRFKLQYRYYLAETT